jgi:hypothetical protein
MGYATSQLTSVEPGHEANLELQRADLERS